MRYKTNNQEKIIIEWDLTCNYDDAMKLLSESVENLLLPWFMSKTKIKGFVIKNKFMIWPNTLYAGSFWGLIITGKIIEGDSNAHLSAKARLLPPFNLFPVKESIMWFSGVLMVIAWILIVLGVLFEKTFIAYIFIPIFLVSLLYNGIQFMKSMMLKPELLILEKTFYNLFKQHIIEN